MPLWMLCSGISSVVVLSLNLFPSTSVCADLGYSPWCFEPQYWLLLDSEVVLATLVEESAPTYPSPCNGGVMSSFTKFVSPQLTGRKTRRKCELVGFGELILGRKKLGPNTENMASGRASFGGGHCQRHLSRNLLNFVSYLSTGPRDVHDFFFTPAKQPAIFIKQCNPVQNYN